MTRFGLTVLAWLVAGSLLASAIGHELHVRRSAIRRQRRVLHKLNRRVQ